MSALDQDAERGDRAFRHLQAELQKADVTLDELAQRLQQHGCPGETPESIAAKLKKGPFGMTFLHVCLTELGGDGSQIEHVYWPVR